jgi:sigma-E factor negative regulatory protein RseC
MEQIGEVVELSGRRALVRIHRTSSCGENCASCSGECTPTSTIVEAINGISAKVGDTVKMEMNSGSFLFLAFIGYILPILVCIGAYFLAKKFTDNIMIADAVALLSLLAVLVIFFFVDKLPKRSTRFSSRIIKILR